MIVHRNKIKPAGMELSDFLATKIVFQNLIDKKQWKEDRMDLYLSRLTFHVAEKLFIGDRNFI